MVRGCRRWDAAGSMSVTAGELTRGFSVRQEFRELLPVIRNEDS